jgi:putative (di)nucleoside polyphosphate hydrolase
MIDHRGYRANVGIILCNKNNQLLWARRINQDSWQFPQGGINENETPESAMYRELHEEVGLLPEHVAIRSCTKDWLHYNLPKRHIRYHQHPHCIGQKQIWFLLDIKCDDTSVDLNKSDHQEFDHWQWVDYWRPAQEVVHFKKHVYINALTEFAPLLFSRQSGLRIPPQELQVARHPYSMRRQQRRI